MPAPHRTPGSVTLRALLHTVGEPLVRLLSGPRTRDQPLRTLALVEAEELRERSLPAADALLLVGARDALLPGLLPFVPDNSVVFVKLSGEPDVGLLSAAARRGISVVRVHREASWDQLTSILHRLLGTLEAADPATSALAGTVSDLFALAETVAAQVRGLVTIEDSGGEVLAYSRAIEGADELRISSILGRRGPADQMRRLSDEGVLSALASEGSVLRVPANEELGRAARLAAGIHSDGRQLGTLWVQEGREPFSADANALIPGAARLAARLMRGREHPAHRDDRLVLVGLGLGAEPAGEAPRLATVTETYALASLLNPQPHDLLAVIGVTVLPVPEVPTVDTDAVADPPAAELTADTMSYLRLHAASYRRPIALAAHRGTIYGVVATSDPDALQHWAASALADAGGRFGRSLRAAVAEAPGGMVALPEARRSVDHLLDAVRRDPARYPAVVSLSGLRSDVLLSDIVALVADQPRLRDPRLDALREHDTRSGGELVASIRAYLDAFSDVRAAAAVLRVHPNTLRYRLGRAEDLSGLALNDPATRIVLGVLLRLSCDGANG
ncbi:helix-turn-helix domain-containing protein [Klugiella xanthotipulae]|uniref:DNA-binding PucR family transcriptional regulator n=1 Tax=Klugiella xanthotipulae TaxID=244735 RepID=A0A543I732_9MICO|nr:PucR family transcriptional regulator [Klugiella xanthotipulae]TQM66387.1 DNA-binding PucR family transcriptional regulator [Klugiella xanthotipulae]